MYTWPRTLPYFSFTSVANVFITTLLAFPSRCLRYSLASIPNFFSFKSVVLDSGVSIPASLTLLFVKISKPRSITTSIVSLSITSVS